MFAEAVKPTSTLPVTHRVEPKQHFFQHRIDERRAREAARNMTRQEMFNRGLIQVSELDDDELVAGRCRGPDGKIPKVTRTLGDIPRDLYEEMIAEHHRRTHELYRQQLNNALNTMVECMTDPAAEWRDRNDAAKYITERVMGKPQERVNVTVTKAPWEELMGDVAHITREQHQALKAGTIDAEVVELPEESNAQYSNVRPPGVGDVRPSNADREPNHAAERSVPVDADHQPRHDVVAGPETQPFEPPYQAPSHVQPANSNAVAEQTLSEQIAAAQAEAERVAEARAARKKLIQDAKRKRMAMRATGADVLHRELRKGVDAESFAAAQDRLTRTQGDEDERGS